MKTRSSGTLCGPQSARGFTLTEILVVIVIVIILALVGFSSAQRMRTQAKSMTCIGNLKQVGTALITYSADNNDRLIALAGETADGPTKPIWPVLLARAGHLGAKITPGVPNPCGKGVWACPSCDHTSDNHGGYGVVEGIINYPAHVDRGPSRMSLIESPSTTWLVGDAQRGSDPKNGWYAVRNNPKDWKNGGPAAGRHGNRVNVCMFDGHIESLTLKELEERKYLAAKKSP